MNIEIEKLTTWSAGREVRTQNGPRILRKGPLTAEYRAAWRANKEAMKAVGLSMGPVDRNDPQGEWEAIWWQPINGDVAKERDAAVEASRATDAQIDVPAPDGLAYMPFQKAGIAAMRSRPATLLCDSVGLGKTVQAIGVVNCDESVKSVLVVVPASLKVNWKNELRRWLVRPLSVAVQNAGEPWVGDSTDVTVLNYELLGKFPQIYTRQWDMLVADECHAVKNRKAQRTRFLLGATKKEDREQFPGVRATRKIFMTATPILNKPIEIFPLLESLEPGRWGWKDKVRYCAGFQGRWGWDFTGHAFEEEFQRRLRENVMVRRLQRDVLKELPPKRRQIIELPCNGSQDLVDEENEIYDRQQADMEAAQADMALADAADDGEAYKAASDRLKRAQKVAFSEVALVRHQVAMAKVPQVIEHVRNVLEDTSKVVLFCHHLDVAAAYGAEFGVESLTVTGETAQDKRQEIIDRFNSDASVRVLILGIRAAGVGLSVKASVEVFAELDFVPGIVNQAEGRCYGIGRGIEGEPLLVQHLVLEGSLDARMVKTIVAKQDVADRMLDKPLEALAVGEPVTAVDIDLPAVQEPKKYELTDPELHDAVLRGLQMLAGVCDGAAMRDDMGFNGCDARIGHSLARLSRLSPKQVALGRRLLIKYRRQLPHDVNEKIRGKDTE